MAYKIGVVVGSLRKESWNRRVARALVQMAPASLQFEFVEIGSLCLYNQDLDPQPPAEWTEFRQKLKSFDGILFATPEYNRSVPGVLKNAIDIGSRPSKENSWNAKPCAVISVTPGNLGAFGANHHLRQSLVALNMPTMPQPEVYLSGAAKLFNDQGKIENESTQKILQSFIDAFAKWMEVHAKR